MKLICLGRLGAIAFSLFSLTALAQEAASSYAPPIEKHIAANPSAAATKKGTRIQNRKLAAQVRRAMTKDGQVDMTRVVVFAKAGTVTLSGSVPENDQVQVAQERAGVVPGVSHVTNNLVLSTPGH